MLLRIRREIVVPGKLEKHLLEDKRYTRKELCFKYHLPIEDTIFSKNGIELIEDKDFCGDIIAVVKPRAGATAGTILLLTLITLSPVLIAVAINTFQRMKNIGNLKIQYSNNIRGATNQLRKNGPIGLLFGNSKVYPDMAGLPFSSYKDNDQYIHQLFCFGYNDVVVDTDTLRLGDTLLSDYKDVFIEDVIGDTLPSIYNKRVIETNLSRELTGKTDSEIIQTTATNTTKVGIGITAPYGIYSLDSSYAKINTPIHYKAQYRLKGDTTWIDIIDVDTSLNVSKYRNMIEFTFPTKGQYDIKVFRVGAVSDNSKVRDSLVFDVLQSYTVDTHNNASPVINPEKYRLIAIKIKATDQLNGYLDKINADCKLLNRYYDGTNNGAASWVTDTTYHDGMANPASILLHVLTNPNVNPRALSNEQINWLDFQEWYNFCDTRAWECNAWVSEEITIQKLIEQITYVGRANFRYIDGSYGITIQDKTSTISQIFTPRNTWGMVMSKSFEEQPTLVKCEFINKETNEEEIRYVLRNAEGVLEFDNEVDNIDSYKSVSIKFWGVTIPKQVGQLGAFYLSSLHVLKNTYQWDTTIEQLSVAEGDVVYLANDVFMYSLGYGRITKVDRVNGLVTAIYLDELMGIDPTKSYGITVRLSDGTIKTYPIDQNLSTSTKLIPIDAIPDDVEIDNLFIYGDVGKKVKITKIEPSDDRGATIIANDYVPELYDVDIDSVIPTYVSRVSKYGSGVNFGQGAITSDLPSPAGANGTTTIYQYAISTSLTNPPTGEELFMYGGTPMLFQGQEMGYLGVWSDTMPDPTTLGDNQYIWERSRRTDETEWSILRRTGKKGADGEQGIEGSYGVATLAFSGSTITIAGNGQPTGYIIFNNQKYYMSSTFVCSANGDGVIIADIRETTINVMYKKLVVTNDLLTFVDFNTGLNPITKADVDSNWEYLMIGEFSATNGGVISNAQLKPVVSLKTFLSNEFTSILNKAAIGQADIESWAKAMGCDAYYNTLAVSKLFAGAIFAQEIKLTDNGTIHSDFYLPDGTINQVTGATSGFYINANGVAKFNKAELNSVSITGDGVFGGDISTSIFSAIKGVAGETYTVPPNDSWSMSHLLPFINATNKIDLTGPYAHTYVQFLDNAVAASGIYDGKTFHHLLFIVVNNLETRLKVWHSDNTFSYVIDIIHRPDDPSEPSAYGRKEACVITAPFAFDSANHIDCVDVSSLWTFLNDFENKGVKWTATGTIYVGTGRIPKVIAHVEIPYTAQPDYVNFYLNDDSLYTLHKNIIMYIDGSFTIEAHPDTVSTMTILPKSDTSDIGDTYKSFRNMYLKNLHSTDIFSKTLSLDLPTTVDSGYIIMPNGLIMQFGNQEIDVNSRNTFNFPIPFPNGFGGFGTGSDWHDAGGWAPCGGTPLTLSQYILWNVSDHVWRRVYWIAIGW